MTLMVMRTTMILFLLQGKSVYMMMVNHVVNGDEDDNCNDAFSDL